MFGHRGGKDEVRGRRVPGDPGFHRGRSGEGYSPTEPPGLESGRVGRPLHLQRTLSMTFTSKECPWHLKADFKM